MALSIDPNVKGVINGVVAICGVLTLIGASAFPSYIPQGIATDVVQTAGFIFTIYGALNSGANFLSSSKPGLLAPPDPPIVVAAQKVADLPPNAGPAVVAQAKRVATEAVVDHQP